jgi:PAS domain S-box-containing protein
VQVSASIASGEAGNPSTVIGLFENISERRETREALEKAYADLRILNETLEQRVERRTVELRARTDELDRAKQTFLEQSRILRLILDSMGDAVYVVDAAGTLAVTNPAAERISGPIQQGIDMVVGRANQPSFFQSDGQTRCLPQDLPVMRSARGESVDNQEIMIHRPDRPGIWVSSTGRPLLDQNGKLCGAVVVARDVTDRRRRDSELNEAYATLERVNASLREREQHFKELAESHLRLAREVEHRVRNNLQGLLGLLSVMRDSATDVATFADAMESRLAGMHHVHQLLAQTQWKAVGMRALIDGALNTLQHLSCHPTELQVSGPDILIGPRQLLPLTLVIVEWFTNSCKYGAHNSPGGQLKIRWEVVGDDSPPRLRLTWTERGGPPIVGPIVPSLGTDLVLGFVRRGLSGTVELRFPREGADHVLEFNVRDEASEPGQSVESVPGIIQMPCESRPLQGELSVQPE